MARWLVMLVLTVAVGTGFVSSAGEGVCVTEDCAGDEHAGMADECGDDCSPFCGGCARVAAQPSARVALPAVTVHGEPLIEVAPTAPPAAPPSTGLFRPPRA